MNNNLSTTKYSVEDIIISEHGYVRMKERNGWNRKAATRMMNKIYKKGLRPEQVKGYLKNWVMKKVEYGEGEKEFILFGEKLYVFYENIMITVIPTPGKSYLLKEA